MDIKEYISSGILERYVLGTVSSQERQEVECMSHIYPDIYTELRNLEQTLENFATAGAKTPPKHIREKILNQIENINQEAPLKIIKNERPFALKPINPINYWRWTAVASFLIILGIGYLMRETTISLNEVQQQVAGLSRDSDQLEVENERLRKQLTELNELKAEKDKVTYLLAHHATKKIEMSGTDNSPKSMVRVYWNTATKNVLLKVDDLPEPPEGKQYQLWAIADGNPLDMGVFKTEKEKDASVQFMPINCNATAQAFAVTLENEGGSSVPTLSAMYVLGNV